MRALPGRPRLLTAPCEVTALPRVLPRGLKQDLAYFQVGGCAQGEESAGQGSARKAKAALTRKDRPLTPNKGVQFSKCIRHLRRHVVCKADGALFAGPEHESCQLHQVSISSRPGAHTPLSLGWDRIQEAPVTAARHCWTTDFLCSGN